MPGQASNLALVLFVVFRKNLIAMQIRVSKNL